MNPEGRWYPALVGVLALAFLSGSGVLLIVMLATVFGPFSVESVRFFEPLAHTRIGVWHPPSARALPDADPDASARAWAAVFPDPFELRMSDDLAELVEDGARVVAVSDARALSAAEWGRLERYAEQGGGVLLCGWIGVWSAPGSWQGTGTMQTALGVERVEVVPFSEAFFLAAGVPGPLRFGVEPGARIVLPAAFEAPALVDRDAELYWADWRLAPRRPAAAASLRRAIGQGSLVWIASPPFPGSETAGSESLRRVYRNAVAWMGRLPAWELATWPRAAPLAALLALDTEQDFANAHRVATLARRQGIPVSYMVLSSLAERSPEVLRELAESGEIGSHADVHDGFEGLPPDLQRERLQRSLDQLRGLGVEQVRGFRAPLESADAETLRAVADLGLEYVLGDPELPSLVPRLHPEPGSGRAPPLVRIPRGALDDVDLIVKQGRTDPAVLWPLLRDDLEHAAHLGGLYYLSFHTQHLARPEYLPLLDRVVDALVESEAWIASGADIAAWWRQRSGVQVNLRQRTARRLDLEVSNTGSDEAQGLVVRIDLHRGPTPIRIRTATVLTRTPRFRWLQAPAILEISLPPLPAGQSRRYTLDLDPEDARSPEPAAPPTTRDPIRASRRHSRRGSNTSSSSMRRRLHGSGSEDLRVRGVPARFRQAAAVPGRGGGATRGQGARPAHGPDRASRPDALAVRADAGPLGPGLGERRVAAADREPAAQGDRRARPGRHGRRDRARQGLPLRGLGPLARGRRRGSGPKGRGPERRGPEAP